MESDSVLTLSAWADRLLKVPNTIECAAMVLRTSSGVHVFEGSGHINILSRTRIEWTMHARTIVDEAMAHQIQVRAQSNPYETIAQFVLEVTDYLGVKWNCGWTRPRLKGFPTAGRIFTGSVSVLSAQATGVGVSKVCGVELVVDPVLRLHMGTAMTITTSLGEHVLQRQFRPGAQAVDALGSRVSFFHLPTADGLWVTAACNDLLTHPHTENWLLEPVRILLGKPVYPRLVARNFGDGTAMVTLRASPNHETESHTGVTSLYKPREQDAAFWRLYPIFLALVARSRDKAGHPLFEANPVTNYYVEVAMAARGSRWALYLSLASSVEGIAKLLMIDSTETARFEQQEIESLGKHLNAWTGDEGLRRKMLSNLQYANTAGVAQFLKSLVASGKVQKIQADAWSAIRNRVMHGNLVDPWATKEEDLRVENLAGLMHNLALMLAEKESLQRS